MEIKYNGNGFIIYRNHKITKELVSFIKEGIELNKRKFLKKPSEIIIYICDNEKEFKKYSKYYYFPHGAGTCLRTGEIILRSNDVLKRSNTSYKNLVAHELTHSFWMQLFKVQKPVWINEGLATSIEGRLKYDFLSYSEVKKQIKKKKWDEGCLKYRYLEKDFNSKWKIELFYSVWTRFLEFLCKGDLKLIINFMFEYSKNPSKSNYEKLFKKYFGNTIKIKFKEFLEK